MLETTLTVLFLKTVKRNFSGVHAACVPFSVHEKRNYLVLAKHFIWKTKTSKLSPSGVHAAY
jgi:hypothetical protein